jgi:CubicO group peptidase (beta-lactamase class C family)
MPRLRSFVLLTAAIPSLLTAQAQGLRITPARIDAVFKDYGPKTPGCALGIYNKGRVLYTKGYGMADLNLGIPITPRTVFDIGSTSKQFAAAAIVLLANDGKLSLTDDVRKHIPELPDYGTVITIDHMLRHTSGLRDYNGLLFLAGHYFEDYTTDADALDVIVAQRALNFNPGTKWDYSNSGYFLLSVIVKRVTGQTLEAVAQSRLFSPLGMTITHFRTNHNALLPNRAVAYAPGNGPGEFALDMSNWDQAGDGAVNTNVLELARWDANFYTPAVGGQSLVDQLQERGRLTTGDTLQYARGLFVDSYRGLRRVQHGGAWAGYRAMLMRFPDQGVAIGMTCNVGNADTMARSEAVADVILTSLFAASTPGGAPANSPGSAKPEQTPVRDAAYAGAYFSDAEQALFSIEMVDGAANLKANGATLPLAPATRERLTALGGSITIDFTDALQSLSVTNRGRVTGPFRRVAAFTPEASDLAEIAGSYRSAELGATWTVRQKGAVAILSGRAVGESTLTAAFKDGYSADGSFVMFTRGSDGRINGFNLTASRMKRIRFER